MLPHDFAHASGPHRSHVGPPPSLFQSLGPKAILRYTWDLMRDQLMLGNLGKVPCPPWASVSIFVNQKQQVDLL